MSLRRKLAAATVLASLAWTSPALADAITLDSVGDTVTLNYDGMSDGQKVQGLAAATTLTLTGITGTSYTFDYSLTNNTQNPVDSRISSFGFNTSPNPTGAASTGTYGDALVGGQAPNPFKNVDVCFKAGGSNSCSGS